jgi:peptidyl-prolyl cis-trans isomerase C
MRTSLIIWVPWLRRLRPCRAHGNTAADFAAVAPSKSEGAFLKTVFAAALALVAACGGCDQARQDFNLPPRGAGPAVMPGVVGAVPGDAELAPIQPMMTSVARPRDAAPVRPTPGPATSPDDSKLEARLDNVKIPLPSEPPPVLADFTASPRIVDAVLAQVNNEVITREDILGPLRPQIEQWRKQDSPAALESRIRQVIIFKLQEMIEMRLVVQEAKAKLTEDQKKEIDAQINQTIKEMISVEGSLHQLEMKIQADGSTLEAQKAKLRDEMMFQRFLREKIAPSVQVTHSELLDYYAKVRQERYVIPTKMQLGLVAIKKTDAADAEQARALAETVRGRIVAGEDFAALAVRYSRDAMRDKGGDWGLMAKGAFRIKEVDAALFALKAGQVAPLVETADTFYIVKALDRQEGRVKPFTEVQATLDAEMRDQRYNQAVAKYVQELYQRSYRRTMWENL